MKIVLGLCDLLTRIYPDDGDTQWSNLRLSESGAGTYWICTLHRATRHKSILYLGTHADEAKRALERLLTIATAE